MEAVVACSDCHLPAWVDSFVDNLARDLILSLALVSLHIQLNIILETLHLFRMDQEHTSTHNSKRVLMECHIHVVHTA